MSFFQKSKIDLKNITSFTYSASACGGLRWPHVATT